MAPFSGNNTIRLEPFPGPETKARVPSFGKTIPVRNFYGRDYRLKDNPVYFAVPTDL